MQLSRNFSLSELIKSDTAIRQGINNNPNAEQIEKLKALCENILQPVRDHFGRVKITSGYRSPELCIAIGSSINSQHAKAEAADFECPGVDNAELADWIHRELPYDQLILSSILRVNLIADGYIVVGFQIHLELHIFGHIDQKVKLNTNLFLEKQQS